MSFYIETNQNIYINRTFNSSFLQMSFKWELSIRNLKGMVMEI